MSAILEERTRPAPWRLAVRVCLVACVLILPALPAAADETQSVHDSQWPLQAANADRAWAVTKGDGVTVAVIDSGVEATHPDLRGRVSGGGDFGDGASGDGTHDAGGDRGHGTEVASLIAGTGENYDGDGLLGLAPDAKILSFGVYRDGESDLSAVPKAIRRAADAGAQVIVTPALGASGHRDLASAVRHALDSDVLVISGVPSPSDPAASVASAPVQGIVEVTAVDRDGMPSPRVEPADHVVLAGPGTQVLAAASDGTYWTGDDTSFAAAWVAGTAALVRAANPDWSAGQTVQKLIDTARSQQCDGDCGEGVVNPLTAVTDTKAPAAKVNPLLETSAAPDLPTTGTSTMSVPWGRATLLISLALGALLIYVGVTVWIVRRRS